MPFDPSEHEIESCKQELCHGCDGHITRFVLISRATTWAVKNHAIHNSSKIAANALDSALEEFEFFQADVFPYHSSEMGEYPIS